MTLRIQRAVYLMPLLLFILSSTIVARAQLSGELDAKGAYNLQHGHNEALGLKLQWDTTRYTLRVGLNGGHDFIPTNEYVDIEDAKKESHYVSQYEERVISPRSWQVGGFLNLNYRVTDRDRIEFGGKYGYTDCSTHNQLQMAKLKHQLLSGNVLQTDTLFGDQLDSTRYRMHAWSARLYYEHLFAKGKTLGVAASTDSRMSGETMQRRLAGNLYATEQDYATRAYLGEQDYALQLHYNDDRLGDVEGLKLSTGLDAFFNYDLDEYHADYGGGAKSDTTLGGDYTYLSQFTEPFIKLRYQIRGWEFNVEERPQVYTNIHWNMELSQYGTIVHRQTRFNNIAKGIVAYTIRERHRLEAGYQYTVVQPDYRKFSPIITMTGSNGEFLVGNPDLRPERSHKANLRYTYTRDHIKTIADIHYRHTYDRTEKVTEKLPSQGEVIRTLKTWVNTQNQSSLGGTMRLRINYERINAEIWGGVNWERFTYINKNPKTEINYNIGLSMDARLNNIVDVRALVAYNSPTRSAFTEKNEYVDANLRMTFHLPERVNLYVEATDIVDMPRTEINWNAELTYMKIKTVQRNRRCIGLGLTYNF